VERVANPPSTARPSGRVSEEFHLSRFRRATAVALSLSMLLGVTQVAGADAVSNNASSQGRNTITAGASTTITYTLAQESA
jgi:hypothetical protein